MVVKMVDARADSIVAWTVCQKAVQQVEYAYLVEQKADKSDDGQAVGRLLTAVSGM